MSNLYTAEENVDFWVWINPKNWLVRHQIEFTGGFTSGGLFHKKSNLMFIPNQNFQADITPFQLNIMSEYIAEYNLELSREANFAHYPSRLNAIYLFDHEEEAYRYKDRHMYHVGDRILKKVHSVGSCVFSKHDSSWVDFLRISHSLDPTSIDNIGKVYWSGDFVENQQLLSLGKPWSEPPIIEVLFIGRVEFYDRNLEVDLFNRWRLLIRCIRRALSK
jgi:hypothetical protein